MCADSKGHEQMSFLETALVTIISDNARFAMAEALETEFKIELEREEISAWSTVQDVINSVKNQHDARVETDETCAASGAGCDLIYMQKFDSYGCNYCGRDATPAEDKQLRAIDAEPEAVIKPPINQIERKDVEDFRTGNYTVKSAFNQYQDIAIKSAIYPGKGTPFGLMYVALGLAEAGEVQNKVKKGFRDDMWIEFYGAVSERGREVVFNPITPARREQVTKELRGLLWYVAATATELGVTLHDIALGNLEELCGRGERGTLGGDGDNR